MGKALKMRCDLRRLLLIMFCFAAVCVLGVSHVCSAAAPTPNGTYKKTCRNISYNASTDRITGASCKKLNGSWNTTQFNNCSQCRGDIENCNGTIECTGVNIPNVGSYKRSCFCCRMVGSTLSCYCNPKKGTSRWTSLNNATNYSDIWNDNGSLKGRQ
ncbi:MAG: CVNH domain-containing protein [Syntrophaceae bacterium]